jgi:hypothetical protein
MYLKIMISKLTLALQNKVIFFGFRCSHKDAYKQYGLLGHKALYFRESLTFQTNTSPLSSGMKSTPNMKPGEAGGIYAIRRPYSSRSFCIFCVLYCSCIPSLLSDCIIRSIWTYFGFISIREG